jgi:hypothetical protein
MAFCSSLFLGLLDVSINERTTPPFRETTPIGQRPRCAKYGRADQYTRPSAGSHRCPFRDCDCRLTTCLAPFSLRLQCPLRPPSSISPRYRFSSLCLVFSRLPQPLLFGRDPPGACTTTTRLLVYTLVFFPPPHDEILLD